MKVLVACEESQTVCKAFRARGHEAYSCDIQEPSGGHPEWHIKGDVLPILNGGSFTTEGGCDVTIDKWDLIIAHPPCTKTSNAGAKHLYRGHKLNLRRYYEGLCGKALFDAIWAADCEKLVIENPIPSAVFGFPKATQIVQPWQFGHPCSKKTLLWERGVPILVPTNVVEPKVNCHEAGTWFMKGGKERQKNRSKTFEGIAEAFADQWGGDIRDGDIDGITKWR